MMLKLKATVDINETGKNRWLRFNKCDGNNGILIYDAGPSHIHKAKISVAGSSKSFRLWWASENSKPHLQAYVLGKWSYNEAYDEIKRMTNLPLKHAPRKPDKVTFDVSYVLTHK